MNRKELEMRVKEYRESFCPFGYRNIEEAIKLADELGIDGNELITMQEELKENYCGTEMPEPNETLYNYMSNEIRNILQKEFRVDFDIEYYLDYYCSSWNINNLELDKLKELITENLNEFKELREECLSLNNLIEYHFELEKLFEDEQLDINQSLGDGGNL